MKETDKDGQNTEKGTSALRKIVYPLSFFVAGVLWISFGFWRMLFVALLTLLGFFIGSTESLETSVKHLVNKLFPPAQKKVSYSAEDLDKLKRAIEKKENEEKEPAEEKKA